MTMPDRRMVFAGLFLLLGLALSGCSSHSDSNPLASGPKSYLLDQDYPNPFEVHNSISYTVRQSAHVLLQIYGLQGEVLLTLVDHRQHNGTYSVSLRNLPLLDGGIYFARLTIGDQSHTFAVMINCETCR